MSSFDFSQIQSQERRSFVKDKPANNRYSLFQLNTHHSHESLKCRDIFKMTGHCRMHFLLLQRTRNLFVKQKFFIFWRQNKSLLSINYKYLFLFTYLFFCLIFQDNVFLWLEILLNKKLFYYIFLTFLGCLAAETLI